MEQLVSLPWERGAAGAPWTPASWNPEGKDPEDAQGQCLPEGQQGDGQVAVAAWSREGLGSGATLHLPR